LSWVVPSSFESAIEKYHNSYHQQTTELGRDVSALKLDKQRHKDKVSNKSLSGMLPLLLPSFFLLLTTLTLSSGTDDQDKTK
jgi:hypothetical protein